MDPRAAKLSLWAKENAVWLPFTKYFDAPAETVSERTVTDTMLTESMWKDITAHASTPLYGTART